MSGLAAIMNMQVMGDLPVRTETLKQMAGRIGFHTDGATENWGNKSISVMWINPVYFNSVTMASDIQNNLFVWIKGEIYDINNNSKNLQNKEGIQQKLDTPATFILNNYREKGTSIFKKLNGSFAAVIYDTTSHELLLVSDRCGSHPLFYTISEKMLAFATSACAVAASGLAGSDKDLLAVFEFFTFQMVLSDRTYYKNIKMVPPGTYIIFSNGIISHSKYSEIKFEPGNKPELYYIEALADAFQNAVKRRTEDDKRFGLLLSGGLDSRGILGSDKEGRISSTITIGGYRNREVRIAEKCAGIAGRKHIYLQRDKDYYYNLIEGAIDLADGMDRFDNAHFLGFGDSFIENTDVIINAWWLDDIVKGLHLPLKKIGMGGLNLETPLVESVLKKDIYRVIIECGSQHGRRDIIFAPSFRKRADEFMTASLEPLISGFENYSGDISNVGPYMFFTSSAFKHHSVLNMLSLRPYIIERTVAFDNDLIDLYFETPTKYKAAGRIFKKAISTITPELMNVINTNTLIRAGDSVWKESFSRFFLKLSGGIAARLIPSRTERIETEYSWPNPGAIIRLNKSFQSLIFSTINDETALNPEIFDIDYANRAFQDHIAGKRNTHDLLFLYLTYGIWNKKYGN